MPATDFHGTSAPLTNLGRSILSLRRDQIHTMDPTEENELESFQKQVSDRFAELASASPDELLTLDWVRKLLDAFLCCHEEFRAILFNNRAHINRPPTDRLVSEFYERSIKALDVCNAIRDGIEQIRQWRKLLDIVLCALSNQRVVGEGQFRRAKKALIDLAIGMLDEKESNAALAHRNRSFGRNSVRDAKNLGHFRSLSWSVSRSWSAARQLQALGNNLYPPRGNEIAASNGLAVVIHVMSSVLLFVMWALVAAIPCQDRGLQVHFSIPRHGGWGASIMLIHDRIVEESKKRERKNACGLLREIYQLEKGARLLSELADSVQFPLSEEKEREVKQRVAEVGMVSEALKEGLDPLERQVREVFHRIVRSRTDGLDSLGRVNNAE